MPARILESRPPRRSLAAAAALAVALALGATVWAYVEYAGRSRAPLLALALATTFFSIGAAVLLAFHGTFTFTSVEAQRPTPARAPVRELRTTEPTKGARRGFVALMVGATASLSAIALLPLRSLGTRPQTTLYPRVWRRGMRLFTKEGVALRPGDLAPGSVTSILPSEDAGPSSAAVLVRLREGGELRAYSSVCTHAGCSVCVFRGRESELVCPCHESVFDAAGGGRVLGGPASRRLPELPLAVDGDGYLVADGDFDGPVGPRGG